MRRWLPVIILLIAAGFRLYDLDLKPPHFDEGVNGWFLDQMAKTGYFRYDPANYHGPLHFYTLFISETLLGRNIVALRLPLALVGIVTVWLILKFDRYLDRRICWLAASAMAVSPAFTFYTRYAIHEPEMVFFLILLFFGIAGLWKFGERKYLWAAGMAVTGMILTKETYLIHLACLALAFVALRILEIFLPSDSWEKPAPQKWVARDGYAVLATGIVAIVFFYSGGLLDFSVLAGTYQTFFLWAETGKDGHGHAKDWYYWLKLLWLYEPATLVGAATALLAVLPRTDRLMRLIAIYGLGTLTAFSIINYKTPWCIVSLAWPFLFTFGAFVVLPPIRHWRIPAFAVAMILLGYSTYLACKLNFVNYENAKEPYVYVQTTDDLKDLTGPLEKLTRENPMNYHLTGHILLGSYHPLPWVLGDFTGIGYYGEKLTPPAMDADFLIVDDGRVDEVEAKLTEPYFKQRFELRDAQGPAQLYFNALVFLEQFPGRAPEFVPRKSP